MKTKSFGREIRDTDLPTKFYRSGMAFAVGLIIAGGGYFLDNLASKIDGVARGMYDVRVNVAKIEAIQIEQNRRFEGLERKFEKLNK